MIKNKFANLTDKKTGKNTQYEISDAALSAFAVFFLQNPSFLAQQIALQKNKGKNNLQTHIERVLFHVFLLNFNLKSIYYNKPLLFQLVIE
jgi:hypothetical protein